MMRSERTPAGERFFAFDLNNTDREQAELNGHTIEELSDYLDRGRAPGDPSIDDSPDCEIALRSLERLRRVQRTLLEKDVIRESARDDSWVSSILDNISREAHRGREIPLAHPSPTAHLVVTEGAVRGILRDTGDLMANIIVGRCVLVGDVGVPGTPIVVQVDVNIFHGESIPSLADQLRQSMFTALNQYTELVVEAIDITVRDLYTAPNTTAPQEEEK